MSCNCTLNKYQLTSNEGLNHYTLTELMRLVNGLILDPSFSYAVSNLDELNEIFKFYPTKEETIRILQGETGITPQRQNLNDYNLDYAWLNYYTKEEVITFIVKGYVPEKPPQTYTFTINPVPASATVVINGIESDTVVVYKGEQVLWTVSEDGYTTKMGVQDVEEDTTIDVSLDEYEEDEPSEDKPVYTVCVETEPSDAYVFINGERENCFSGAEGTVFDYTVQAGGYVPQSGKITIDGDKTVAVVLEKEPEPETPRYTLIINPVPASATVIIDGQVRNNITVESGTVVNYSVQAEGYFFQEGTYMVTENYVLDVELEALPNYVPNYYFSINPTPSDATVVINGNEQSTYEAQEGSIIVWSVSKEGYVSQNGTYVMGAEDYVMDVELVEYVVPTFTFTINPTPSDATVIIDGVEQSSITVEGGTIVSYSVDKEGYIARSESVVVDRDMVLNVSLRQIGIYTFTVNPYPNYAIVMIDDEIRNTIAVEEGTVVTWVVKLTGYASQAGTYKVEKDSSINVFIECMGEPQIVSTKEEMENAGKDTGVIDLCGYDLIPYTGAMSEFRSDYIRHFTTLSNNLRFFEGDLTSNGRTDLSRSFYEFSDLEKVVFVGDLSKVKNLEAMFMNCVNLTDVSFLQGQKMESPRDISQMFAGCDNLKEVELNFGYTGAETWGLFSGCEKLEKVTFGGYIKNNYSGESGSEFRDAGINSENGLKIYYPCKYKWYYDTYMFGERNGIRDDVELIPYGDCCDVDEPMVITSKEELYNAGLNNNYTIDLCHYDLSRSTGWFYGSINPYIRVVEVDLGVFRSNSDVDSPFTDNPNLNRVLFLGTGNPMREYMFKNCSNLVDISFLNYCGGSVSGVEAFAGCTSLADVSPIRHINLSNGLFKGCTSINKFENCTVTFMGNSVRGFSGCTNLTTLEGIERFDVYDTKNIDISYVFSNCTSLSDISPLSTCDFSKITKMNYLFEGCTSLTDISPLAGKTLNGSYIFTGCTSLVDISPLATCNIKNYIGLFDGCTSLVDISPISISGLGDYTRMFRNCTGITNIDGLFPNSMNSYNVISPVYDDMFEGCSNISDISVLNDIEILNGNIPNIFTYATNMFYNCDGLKSVNLSGDFIDYNIDLRGGFAECSNLESATIKKYHYSNWNIEGLFVNCTNLKKAEINAYMKSGNRVCSVNIGSIFKGCSSLNEIYFYASSLGSYSLDCFYGLPPVGTFHYGGGGFTDEFLSLLPDGWTVVKDYN